MKHWESRAEVRDSMVPLINALRLSAPRDFNIQRQFRLDANA